MLERGENSTLPGVPGDHFGSLPSGKCSSDETERVNGNENDRVVTFTSLLIADPPK